MKNSLYSAIWLFLFCVLQLAGMESLVTPSVPQSVPWSVCVLKFTIEESLKTYEKNQVEYRQLLALRNLFFPASMKREYLIAVHAKAAALGRVEIKSCGESLIIKDSNDIFKKLLTYFTLNNEYEESLLRSDFDKALKEILGKVRIF